jgi:SAM-dependent methyltransferase
MSGSAVIIYCNPVDASSGEYLAEYFANSRLQPSIRIFGVPEPFAVQASWGALLLAGNQAIQADWQFWRHLEFADPFVLAELPGASGLDRLPEQIKRARRVRFSHNIREMVPSSQILSTFLQAAIERQSIVGAAAVSADSNELIRSTVSTYSDPDYAERYFEKWRNDIPLAQLEDLLKHVPAGGRILDAGCGPGHHSAWLAARGYRVVGIDLAEPALEIARRSNAVSGARFVQADMRFLTSAVGGFDAVWASGSCIHLPRPELRVALESFKRVLRPGGHLGITMQVTRLAALEEDGRFFEGHASAEAVRSIIEDAKFVVKSRTEESTTANTRGLRHLVHWTSIVAQKKNEAP